MKLDNIIDFIRGDQDCIENLEKISTIHMYTKHYLLVAEELSEDSVAFLQPLKEHRDAYDHLMRVFYVPYNETLIGGSRENLESYVKDNIQKAVGHEYRSFYDTADWLTFICRKWVREQLGYRGIRSRYENKYGKEDLQTAKDFINGLPFQIAEYRDGKDVGKRDAALKGIENYKETLEKLIELYRKIQAL